jgi:two-component system sensor histidine kinase/response regulator
MSMKCPPPHLRVAAETRLAQSSASEVTARSDTELLHELQVHQIELEMQNEALIEAHIALEESRDRFVDFYELAPVSYLTITDKGLISDINLTGATLLGAERKQLLLKPFARFVMPADADRYHSHFFSVLKTADKLTCELALLHGDGIHIDVRLDSLRLIKVGHIPALRVVLTDITERKLAEKALEVSRRLSKEAEQIGKVGGWEVCIATGKQTWTEETYRIHEVDLDYEPTVEKGINFYTAESRPTIELAVRKAIEHGEPFDVELEIVTAKGNIRSVHAIGKADIQHGRVYGFFQDMTETKQAEVALREAYESLNCILDTTLDGFWCVDGQGRLLDVNSTYSQQSGYTREELLGMGITDLEAKESAVETAERIQRVIKSGADQFESRHRRKDGTIWDVEVSTTYRDIEGGQFFVFLRDITERKQAMTFLKASEQRFRDLVNTTDGIVWEADATTFQFTYISEKAVSLLGFPADEWTKPGFWVEHLHPDDLVWAPEFCASCTGRLEPHDFEYRFIARDGRTVWLHDIVSVVAENGAPRWLRGIMVDVTRQKKNETELIQYRDHLEELVAARTSELAQSRDAAEAGNRAKTIFLANMSHELRTPMNGVMGMIDLALRRATDPKQIDWLNKSKGAAQRMVDVVADILDYSKIEAERLPMEEKNFSLSQMIDDAIAMQDVIAGAKGLKLIREIPSTFPDQLSGDAFRVRQLLLNFLGNACKFSDQGMITVRAAAVEQGSDSVLARIEVEDQGIGISPEQQAMLFQAFTQADGSMTRKYGGSGLGLIISKRLANLMGGDVGVVSQEGHGCAFWATVRLKLVKASEVGS